MEALDWGTLEKRWTFRCYLKCSGREVDGAHSITWICPDCGLEFHNGQSTCYQKEFGRWLVPSLLEKLFGKKPVFIRKQDVWKYG